MKNFKHVQLVLVALFASALVWSCKDKNEVEVLSGFSYAVDQADFRKVTFTNTSSGYTSVSWDFGDGSATSTEENPVHVYQTIGTYTVTLTATGSDNSTNVSSQEITISDPDAELTKLAGVDSKTWKLIRTVSPGVWPLEVGPISRDQVWWAMGRDNDEIAKRPCIMNDEYTFTRSGQYIYNSNGDFWAEGGVFSPANLCQETNATNLKGENGEDLSAFGDGTHSFVMTSTPTPKLEVKGLGAFIGLPKIGTDSEVKVPQTSVVYDILKLTDGVVDTLILEVSWKFGGNTSGADDAYWKMVLVHYDNPADEPGIPAPKPVAGYTGAVDGLRIDFTNTSTNALSYNWDFGDGSSSTQANPSHTYAAAGAYTVVLTATNDAGSSTYSQEFTVTSGSITEADLIGGAWKVRNAANSIFVGPALGSNAWWGVPANFLDGSSAGAEDWSCMTNDEFIFSSGGVYEYKTNGDARNDGYMGSPNGCWSDAQVAASGNGAAFGSAVHSFTFTPADGTNRPIITLTNGSFGAAFVGFYKGYYGGENSNSANPPNGGATTNRYEVMSYLKAGGVETLTLSVDISADKNGSAAWTVVLTR
ncbi:MAG: PKD domain-containing protein [Chitinophagales bacterium]|jgi:PKD repeat protein